MTNGQQTHDDDVVAEAVVALLGLIRDKLARGWVEPTPTPQFPSYDALVREGKLRG